MAYAPKGAIMVKIGIDGTHAVACIDRGALNSAWVDKMKFRRVK